MVQEAVEDCRGGGHVLQEFAPVLGRSVAGHDGGFVFVPAHNNLEEVLSSMFGQLLEAHVIDDEQIGFEIMAEGFVTLLQRFLREEIGDDIKDGAVAHDEALLDGFIADGLGEVGFANAGRADEEDIGAFADEVASGQFVDLFPRYGAVKPPVKVLQRFEFGELRRAGAQFDALLMTQIDLVLEDQLQELQMAEPVGPGLLESEFQRGAHAGEFELF